MLGHGQDARMYVARHVPVLGSQGGHTQHHRRVGVKVCCFSKSQTLRHGAPSCLAFVRVNSLLAILFEPQGIAST